MTISDTLIDNVQCQNTDREIWRETDGDSIHVTQSGGIGINCGGSVVTMPIREWHKLAWPNIQTASLQAQGDDHRARVAQGLCSPKNPCNSCIALMPIPKPQGDCRAELEKAAWKASRGEGI